VNAPWWWVLYPDVLTVSTERDMCVLGVKGQRGALWAPSSPLKWRLREVKEHVSYAVARTVITR